MKFQLNPQQVAGHAANVSALNGVTTAATEVIAAFQAAGHDPFTRRDFAAVLAALGFEVEAPRVEDNRFAAAAATLATRARKPDGSMKRGYYTFDLTPAPVMPPTVVPVIPVTAPFADPAPAEVATPVETPVVSETPEAPAPVVAPAPAAPVRTPTPVTPSGKGVSFVPTVPTSEVEGYYSTDAGLRRLAVAESKCFGNYSTRATGCGSCPLAAFCYKATLGAMADIAATLDREAEAAEAKANAPEAPVTPEPKAEEPAPVETAEDSGDAEYPAGSHVMAVPFEGICTKCQNGIPEGAMGVHVPGSGMLHPACARVN